MIFIGIDPGKKGAIARLHRNGEAAYPQSAEWRLTPILKTSGTRPEYDVDGMVRILEELLDGSDRKSVIIEKQQAMPGQGRSSCFQIGLGMGLWLGILASLRISHAVVHPRTWKKVILRDVPGTDQKARSILAAQRLFPDVSLLRTPRSWKKDDNIADALLLAEYGRRLG